jgi:hypothetical protein
VNANRIGRLVDAVRPIAIDATNLEMIGYG